MLINSFVIDNFIRIHFAEITRGVRKRIVLTNNIGSSHKHSNDTLVYRENWSRGV